MSDRTSHQTIPEDDETLKRLLHQRLADLAAVAREYDVLHASPAPSDSIMAADNTATNPQQLGHFVGYCMLQAVDVCRSINRAARDDNGAVILPIMSMFTLARSAIECASTVIWVSAPPDRRNRVLRRLQFAHDELKHDAALVGDMASAFDVSEAQQAIREFSRKRSRSRRELRAIADANGISPQEYENRFPGWLAVVEAAGAEVSADSRLLPSVWRMCSGMSHPSLSRGINLLTFTQSGESGNVLTGTLSVNTMNAVGVLSIVHMAVRDALGRWRAAKGQRNTELPVPSPRIPTT